MPDQTSPSRSSMTPPERGRCDGPERSANRAVGAAIVADGLALSVSLYPLPGESQLLLELFPPMHELSELPKLVEFRFVNRKSPEFSTVKLPDLVKLVELLDLVKTDGLPDLVKSLELLNSFEPLTHSVPGFSGGGGGGSSGVPADVLPAWVMLLEFLKRNLPDFSGHGLFDVLTNVAQSLGIPHTPAGPVPAAEVFAIADAQVSALVEAPVSAPNEAPVSAPTEAPVSAPDPRKVGLPEPDPPKPDAQSPEGGSDGGSSGRSDGSSSGGSDGSSS